jgi:TamB, inner membrane protein subunit of TAM complex
METTPPQAEPEEPAKDVPREEKRSRRRRVPRVVVRLGGVLLAVVVALILTGLTVDLGPALRERAEREGSNYLKRPLHIGRISARLVPGTFVFDDLMIEGLTPAERPFLTAKRVTVRIPWWTIATRKLIVDSVDMTDWHMVVETFPNGRHNFPKVTPERKTPAGPSRFTTTVRAVNAARGQFTYQDHGTPWSTIGRNLTVTLYRSEVNNDYRGSASFSNGTIRIQSYEPFGASMRSRFKLADGKVTFDRINLTSDGATSVLDGVVDLRQWPEQIYRIKSHIDFPTQKGIFFHRDRFRAYGQGDFQGTFHLYKGGRELKGTFTSPLAGVNDWRFPNLRGAVLWLPDRLEITDSTSELYGGTARFDYRMAPMGKKGVPTMATWDVQYKDVDLSRLTDFLETQGLRLAGRATGSNSLAWPLGGWAVKRGEGVVDITPPPGVEALTKTIPPQRLQEELDNGPEAGPFNARLPLGYVPIGGRLDYKLDPQWITLGPSWVATPKTYVEFQGETAYGQRSRIPFHVTSLDWQESDRLLAGIMTTFGSPTGAIPIGGYGEFDGVMLEAFSRPRIEGRFSGDGMRAWNVVWGTGRADVVIENSYANVKNAVISAGASEITAEGLFSIGYPRKDGGEQINARVRLTRRPMADLRRAFELDDYDMDGLVSGEYHVYGNYETPLGFGRLLVENGVAYGETFETMSSTLRFEGTGVRLDTIQIAKATGEATGAAWVGWDGTYSFNVDGRRIPVESLKTAAFPRAPLSGLLHFNATGAGNFDEPRYDVKARVDDLFVGDEGVGQVTGRLSLRGTLLTADFEAASPRLSVSGSGRLELTDRLNAEMSMRFQDTSLDPYLRSFEPRLSPFTTAVASGTVRVEGELSDIDRLQISTRVEQLNLKLFDYALANDGPIELSLNNHVLEIGRLRVAGDGTRLQMGGSVQLHEGTVAVEATGEANLGILQGFFRNLRSRGTAALLGQVKGPLSNPQFSGSARISDGRIRHLSAPHGLEAIDGIISFDGTGIRLEDLTARVAGGQVVFGGRVGLEGFVPRQLNLTAVGEQMRLRYPEGLPSNVDADLWLRGDVSAPVLGGTVVVHDAVWRRRFEVDPNIFDLAGGATVLPSGPAGASGLPLRFDIQVTANNTLRVQNNLADIVASADLRLQGTYDRPAIFGRAEVDRGSILFEGNRYVVTRGTIDFLTPPAGNIEPLFDIEAETRVRAVSQSDRSEVFRVTLGVTGTPRSFSLSLGSDPPLPEVDIIGLLFGAPTDVSNAELRALSASGADAAEQAVLKAAGARLLAGSISAPVRRVVEETLKLDTAQIAPTIGTDNDPLSTSIRLILGKRLSPRAYLTFSRPLGGATRDQIIVLEYDQTDRVGYVLTQTGDRTFAVDFRVRRSF